MYIMNNIYLQIHLCPTFCNINKKDECQVGCGGTPPYAPTFVGRGVWMEPGKNCFSLNTNPPQLWLTQHLLATSNNLYQSHRSGAIHTHLESHVRAATYFEV